MNVPVDTGSPQETGSVPFWLTPPAYWMPAHYPTSAWWTHAAFAAWLMDTLRPSSIAELGTHYGFSCFAFAESAKRLRHPTMISALDTWEGDDHAGFYEQEVYDYVREIAQRDYSDSVRLVRGRFSDSRPLFAEGSVDLLHIDGRHGYEDVLADYTDWRSTVREGGVILFHDIAETERGFGVWKLWEEIADPGRSFAFEHGHGLGVLGVGEPVSASLSELFSANADLTGRIRDDFSRLGAVTAEQAGRVGLAVELEQVRAEVRHRAEHERQLQAALDANRLSLEAMRDSTSWRVTAPLRAVGRLRSKNT